MSAAIVKRLRDACPATQDFTHTTQGALMDEAADAIEALTAERDRAEDELYELQQTCITLRGGNEALRAVQPAHVNETPKSEHDTANMLTLTAERDGYRKALERIAGVKGPYSHPFPESNEGYGSFAIVTAREALKGESHD